MENDNLIISASCPVFGGVYKLVEVSGQPKIKISEDTFKITSPGHKRIVRFYNENKIAIGDVIVLKDELIPNGEYIMFDEKEPWRRKTVKNYTQRNLQVPIFIQGELVYTVPSVQEVCRYSQGELASFDDDYKKLANPHKYHVDLSNKLYDLKYGMIKCESEKVRKLELVI